MIIAGIDPGKSGGVAVIGDDGVPWPKPMPMNGDDVDVTIMADYLSGIDMVWIEQSQPVPLFGAKGNFKLGGTYHSLCTMLRCWHIPYQVVRPQEWMKLVFAGMAKPKKEDKIKQSVIYCQRKYPNLAIKKTQDGMSDAVCIAEYGWKMKKGA